MSAMVKTAGTPLGKRGASPAPVSSSPPSFISPRSAAAVALSSFSQCLPPKRLDVTSSDSAEANSETSPLESRSHWVPPSAKTSPNEGGLHAPLALQPTWPTPQISSGNLTQTAPGNSSDFFLNFYGIQPQEQRPSPTSYYRPCDDGPSPTLASLPVPNNKHDLDLALLISPTPNKKPRRSSTASSAQASSNSASYNRKNKSLGNLAVTITERYSSQPPGTVIMVDVLAKELQVERRRVYDVVNILESVSMVIKQGKNVYVWMSAANLPHILALLQHEGIQEHQHDATQHGLLLKTDQLPSSQEKQASTLPSPSKDASSKSLCRLAQQFLEVFLVGNDTISLPEASDKISGGRMTELELAAMVCKNGEPLPTDPEELSAMAAKGLKTKVRRLYDVANVLAAIGILTKVDEKFLPKSVTAMERPVYMWSFNLSPMELRKDVFASLPANKQSLPRVLAQSLAECEEKTPAETTTTTVSIGVSSSTTSDASPLVPLIFMEPSQVPLSVESVPV